jgi:single-strand DNA-binding protein
MATIRQRHEASRTSDASATGDPVVTRVGNLTADPELRLGESSGRPYARMRIAVSTPKVPGDWAGEQETSFYDVTAFGTLAENVAWCLSRGTRVVVTGRGEVRTWTGDDGTEHTSEGILADAIGPDLRWATVTVTRSFRREATGGSAQPAAAEEKL